VLKEGARKSSTSLGAGDEGHDYSGRRDDQQASYRDQQSDVTDVNGHLLECERVHRIESLC
jgi:hypothetical protein